LHLGHLGGPFLSADVLARHLELLGHAVTRISGTDAHEAYVLLTAHLTGKTPREVAAYYFDSARRALLAFDMHQDAFVDMSAEPWETVYQQGSQILADLLLRRGRLDVRAELLPRSRRSGRFVIGPFALGVCPACGAGAAGTSCEDCGMWFGNGDLRNPRPRLKEDDDAVLERVGVVRIHGGSYFSSAEVERRFPSGNVDLFERYLRLNRSSILASHPLGWGVPWRGLDLPPAVVHFSYGLGSYAASKIIAREYASLSGTSLDPFSKATPVTTLVTGGYDAALPCMILLALMDEEMDWQPYQQHVLSRFLLLDGRKFSTSARHVIDAEAYANAGLSTDAFRLYAGRIFSKKVEGDFRSGEFAAFVTDWMHGRLDRAARQALEAAVERAPAPLSGEMRESAASALAKQVAALDTRDADLGRASRLVEAWVDEGEAGIARTAPYWWLKTLAALAYPFMPRWSRGLWKSLGGAGDPTIHDFERIGTIRRDEYVPLQPMPSAILDRLLPTS
jgi:methionyl-tRNA synthetase